MAKEVRKKNSNGEAGCCVLAELNGMKSEQLYLRKRRMICMKIKKSRSVCVSMIKKLLSTGMIFVMTIVSICGCGTGKNAEKKGDTADGSENAVTDGSGNSGGQNSDSAAMGRYLEEVTDLSEFLSGYRNGIFRLDDGKLIVTDPSSQFLASEDNGATWVAEERDWLASILQDGGYIQSCDISADGTIGIAYTSTTDDENSAAGANNMDADISGGSEASDDESDVDSMDAGISGDGSDAASSGTGISGDESDAASSGTGISGDESDTVSMDTGRSDNENEADSMDTDTADDTSEDSFQEVSGEGWWKEHVTVLIVKPDGTQVKAELPAAEEEDPLHIWIADNGRAFVGTYGTVLYEVKEDGSCVQFLTLENSPQKIVFQGNRMIIDGYDFESLLIYDMDTKEYITDEALDTFVKENYGDRTFNGGSWCDMYFFAGEEGVIYLAGDKGVYRHVIGGKAMEQIIDGNLSSLANPSYHLLGMVTLENNEFMAIYTDSRLAHYVYDPNVPTVPNETVKAYSLTENNTLRQAISIYQMEHPEVYVEYEIGIEENSSVTKEDAIKKLNTKVMAGNGPDVLILDDLPMDSYIEKGLLADLSPLIDSLTEDENLFDNIVEAFRQDGRIYTIPCDINLPTLLCREKYVSDIQDLEDIADAVEELRADIPEKDLLRVCSEKGVMKTFSMACVPAWKTGSGDIDLAAVKEFLIQTKRIYEAQMDGLPEEVIEDYEKRNEEYIEYYGTNYEDYGYFAYGMDDMNYTMGYRQLLAGTLGYAYAYAELTSVPKTKRFEDCVNVPMNGQSSNVFCANTLVGISAVTEHTEHAEGLLKVLMGPQDISSMGFSINQESFEKSLFPDDYESPDVAYSEMAYIDENGQGFAWKIYWFDEEQAGELRNRMKTVDTPYVEDSVLEESVYQAGIEYMRGDRSLEEAVNDVEKNMAIYMAE